MPSLPEQKQRLRNAIKERLQKIGPGARAAESRSICRRIVEQLPSSPLVVCAYFPMPSEADIRPLLLHLLEQKQTVFLPRFAGAGFEFRQLLQMDALVKGRFGLQEPSADAPALILTDVTHVLVPGIAFDHAANRLGRGNGGYDKWLALLRSVHPAAQVWGIALDCQIVREMPCEPHDARMDAVITPREMIVFAEGS